MSSPEKLVATANSTSRVLNLDLQHAVDVPSETQYSQMNNPAVQLESIYVRRRENVYEHD